MPSSSWGDLPEELLSTIFQHLANNNYLPDLYQCLAVSRSWRSVAKHLWQSSSVKTSPWLLLPWEQPNKVVFDTSLYKSHLKTDHGVVTSTSNSDSLISLSLQHNLPIDDDNVITYASFGGWLLIGHRFVVSPSQLVWWKESTTPFQHLAFLYNPMSRVIIQLPILPLPLKLHSYITFVMSEASPTNPNCIICVCSRRKLLAFCKPAPSKIKSEGCMYLSSSSSSSWVLLEKPRSSPIYIEYMIFYHKNFYTVDDDGSLFVHSKLNDVLNNKGRLHWPVKESKVAGGYSINNIKLLNSHVFQPFVRLVESKNGELLMIERILEEGKCYKTLSFNVFKLNWGKDKCYWEKITRLGDNEALFLGWRDHVTMSVSDDNNKYRSNCIYFFDVICTFQIWSYGVYDILSNTIHHSHDGIIDDEDSEEEDTGPHFCGLFIPSMLSYN